MNQKLLRLRAILNALGGYDPTDSLNKAHFQRRIYLLQAFGVPLCYKFLYNPAGPTSTVLTRDLLNQEFDYNLKLYIRHTELTADAGIQVAQFKQFEEIFPTSKQKECLRVASLIHFLKHQERYDKPYIKKDMTAGPRACTSSDDFEFVWRMLNEVGLLEQRKVTLV